MQRHAKSNMKRREFGKLMVGGAVLATASRSSAELPPIRPGIKIGTYAQNPTAENMLYLRQLGVKWITSGDAAPKTSTVEGFTRIRQAWESGGFKVFNESARTGPNGAIINVPEIVLNLPGRDRKIEEYLNYLRYLSKAGIHYMTYGFEGNGNWRSGQATVPRGYTASDCDLASPTLQGGWGGITYKEPLSHGRVFSREEIWENFTYFIKRVVPVAEESGVRIGIHPDDPPQPMLAGVPRLFTSFDAYKRGLEIANSPNVGICLCVGTWLEGGPRMGADPVEVIKHFGAQKKLFKIHFRNVTAPLPHFTETLMDDGYYNMYRVMEALVDIDFDGLVIPDHIPELGSPAGGPSPGLAYSIGYLNATLKAAQSNRRKA
jgi:mannonate dehydratase